MKFSLTELFITDELWLTNKETFYFCVFLLNTIFAAKSLLLKPKDSEFVKNDSLCFV